MHKQGGMVGMHNVWTGKDEIVHTVPLMGRVEVLWDMVSKAEPY